MMGNLKQILGHDSVVWDNHCCMPLRPNDKSFLPQLTKVHEAGIDVVTVNIGFGDQEIVDHIKMVSSISNFVSINSSQFKIVRTASDILDAKAQCKLAINFDIEGMNALGGMVDLVETYYSLGVKWMLVAYNLANIAGGGCMENDDGLTEFGKKVLSEMNRIGMVPCGSHSGYKTARELIDLSSSPVIFSHSNPRSVYDHPRNIPDDLMKACASRGGVIGINGIGIFLGNNTADVAAFSRHVEFALNLIGEDHVGIALDYVFDSIELAEFINSNPSMFPTKNGFKSEMAMVAPWQLSEVAEYFDKKGMSNANLRKLFGENHLRIAKTIWK